jgi:hypothetical protein
MREIQSVLYVVTAACGEDSELEVVALVLHCYIFDILIVCSLCAVVVLP